MLELKNVSFKVETQKDVLEIIDNISLTIGDDEFVVITGPNGGGKSTLAKIIAGIIAASMMTGVFPSFATATETELLLSIQKRNKSTGLWHRKMPFPGLPGGH